MEIEVEGPFGSFFLHENAKRPAVLLAGGIGVTPFRSMVVDAAERKLPHNITLVYSNREEKGAPFLDELKALSAKSENFTFVPVMSDTEGYIDEAKIRTYVDLSASPIFYMAGPQAMVLAMRKLLAGMGISSDDIRFEEFSGY
jgi:ferredoxin-NADP reductase